MLELRCAIPVVVGVVDWGVVPVVVWVVVWVGVWVGVWSIVPVPAVASSAVSKIWEIAIVSRRVPVLSDWTLILVSKTVITLVETFAV